MPASPVHGVALEAPDALRMKKDTSPRRRIAPVEILYGEPGV
jgi:hypothetical protein